MIIAVVHSSIVGSITRKHELTLTIDEPVLEDDWDSAQSLLADFWDLPGVGSAATVPKTENTDGHSQ